MKNLLFLLVAIPSILFGQQDVPEKYWLDDSNYEDVINGKSAFGDDDNKVVVVEYWAKFNEANCYPHWKELADNPDIDYYRVNIAEAPVATKKYRVRMAPTIFIILDGIIETKFKAGLDLEFPAEKSEVEEAIKEVQSSDKF